MPVTPPPQQPFIVHHHFPLSKVTGQFIAFILFFLLGALISFGLIQSLQQSKKSEQTITIIGNGATEAAASKVQISATVQVDTQDQSDKTTKDIKKTLSTLGVTEDELQIYSYTSRFYGDTANTLTYTGSDAQPIYPTATPIQTPSQYKQQISILIHLSSKKFVLVDSIITALNNFPAMNGVRKTYTAEITNDQESKARENAFLDARKQIDSIARLNNFHVTSLISAKSLQKSPGLYGSLPIRSVPIPPGEKNVPITVQYEIVYEVANNTFFSR